MRGAGRPRRPARAPGCVTLCAGPATSRSKAETMEGSFVYFVPALGEGRVLIIAPHRPRRARAWHHLQTHSGLRAYAASATAGYYTCDQGAAFHDHLGAAVGAQSADASPGGSTGAAPAGPAWAHSLLPSAVHRARCGAGSRTVSRGGDPGSLRPVSVGGGAHVCDVWLRAAVHAATSIVNAAQLFPASTPCLAKTRSWATPHAARLAGKRPRQTQLARGQLSALIGCPHNWRGGVTECTALAPRQAAAARAAHLRARWQARPRPRRRRPAWRR